MSSVGPQPPPHLIKRKRSIDDTEHPSSPPHKIIAAAAPRVVGPSLPPSHNPDEVNLDESSDDDYGPSISALQPTSKPSSAPRVVGPSLPPAKNPDELAIDESSEDDSYGPSIPNTKPPSPPPKKRVLGPAPPPASLSTMPSHPADDSDSDSDYGPSLPPAPGSYAASQLEQARALAESQDHAAAAQAAAKPQRDDWMLVPPSDSDWTSRVDPTKLKNRKFASGKGAKAPAEKSGVSAMWTETPEQKRQRLEDEVLGRKDAASSTRANATSRAKQGGAETKEERETARRIQEYNDRNRSKSLYKEKEEMQGGAKEAREKEDDPSKRGFDREKDMALGGRLGHGAKKEMLAKAADFGSRFQKGSYL